MKLLAYSIKTWANLEKLFLACFIEDDMEVAMLTLLAMKQKKESIKAFVKRFGVWRSVVHVVYPSPC